MRRGFAGALERPSSRHHLVEDDCKGEDVGSLVRLLPLELLWRHVTHSPEDGAGARQRRLQTGSVSHHRTWPLFRKTEVQQLGPRLGQHDVAGFQVAVHDASAVGRRECLGDLDGVVQRLLERDLAVPQPAGERFAIQILHH